MKYLMTLLSLLFSVTLTGQGEIIGHVYFLNSKTETGQRVPAVAVKINADGSNGDYSRAQGEYTLKFSHYQPGKSVSLSLGTGDQITDGQGKALEWVNDKDNNVVTIPSNAIERPVHLIVCAKGYRDLAAQRYYQIIRTSSDAALANTKKQLDALLSQQKKDYTTIAALSEQISVLEKKADSLSIYNEAFRIASINKDDASKRVLQYLALLDEGKSVQEAREVLSIRDAAYELNLSVSLFESAIKELETRAGASASIFDYRDAIACYDTIIAYSERMRIDPLSIANYTLRAAGLHFADGSYRRALELQQNTLRIREEKLDSGHPALAHVYHDIAWTHRELGEFSIALDYQLKSLQILEADPTIPGAELAAIYSNLGLIYEALGEYDKALEAQKKDLDLLQASATLNPRALGTSYNNIAMTYQNLGQHTESLAYLQKSIAIEEVALGPEHPEITFAYENIALTYVALDEYEKAMEYQSRSLQIREATYHAKHPLLAFSYQNMGIIHFAQGLYDEALKFQEQALAIQEEIYAPDHPDLATSYGNMALISQSLGESEAALEWQKRSIAIRLVRLAPDHPLLAQAYAQIAIIYTSLREYDLALENHFKALTIFEQKFDANHFEIATTYDKLGVTYARSGEPEKALEYHQKAVAIGKQIYPSDHLSLAALYQNLGVAYNFLGEYDTAVVYLKECIRIRELIASDPVPLATSYSYLAIVYRAMGAYSEAVAFQEECLAIFRSVLSADHAYQQSALDVWKEMCSAKAEDAFLKKRYAEALADFLRLHEVVGETDWNAIGLCYYHLGEYLQAIQAYEKAAGISPELKALSYYNNIGLAYLKNQQLDQASVAFTEYEKLYPDEWRTFRNWSMYYALANDAEQALLNLQKAIALGFDDVLFLENDGSFESVRSSTEFREVVRKLRE